MKLKIKRTFITVLMSMLCILSYAQTTVRGQVKDQSGEPIIGASVTIGNKTGAITDVDGNFSVSATPKDVLKISYIGYVTQTVTVGNKTSFDIILQTDNQTLDDVVVIGYGSVKKSNLTSAVTKMSDKAIQDRPLARAEQALQGQLAGVTARTVSGEPGADLQIRVRGAASVNASSDPLYVVDGVPMDNISSLNPSDIASIEVLKDAASAAIYGSRGSNGVVIVTTKRGKSGKPTITFNGSVGFQNTEKKLDVMTAQEWMEFRTRWNDQYYLDACKTKGITGASIKDDTATRLANVGVKYGAKNFDKYVNDDRWFQYMSQEMRDSHTYAETSEQLDLLDWQDKVLRTGVIQNYDLGITGGTDNLSYLVSGGYMKQEGIVVGTDYQRFTLRANVESKINKYVTVGLNIAPTYIVNNGSGSANGKDARIHHALSATPVSEAGVGYLTNVQPNGLYSWAGSTSSPWLYMTENINQSRRVRVLSNAFLRITPFEDLRIEFSGAANYDDLDSNTYVFTSTNANWSQGEGTQSSGGHKTARTWNTLLQVVANYDHTFGKHGVSLMAGASHEEEGIGFSTNQQFAKPFANDAITGSFNGSLVSSTTNTVTENTSQKLISFFGRASYDYDGRYMLSASLRSDGGSVFGTNNKWGLFPAVSAGWMVSNEKFFKDWNIGWLNTLKLRASYGVTGNNNISETAAYGVLTSTTYAGSAAYYAGSLGNTDLGWEKTYSTDLAVDLAAFKNRIQLSVDYYTKTTKDLLYEVPVVGASGFTTTWDNLGEIKNYGVDFELTTHNLTGAFKWDTQFNASYNHNEVISLGTDNTPIYSGFNGAGDGSNASNILSVGHPVNAFYMYEAIGVWKSQAEIDAYAAECGVDKLTFTGSKTVKPGDIKYRDVNHDGDINLNDDRVYLGQPTPKWTFGFTNTFTWKNFDASILFTAQTGGKILGTLGRAIDRPGMGATSNVMAWWKNAWWSEEEPGDGKTPYILSTTTGGQVDSRWLYSSDFLSLKNLTIGYTVPMKSKLISRLRVYASFENLFRIDSYDQGYSPEAANASKSTAPGGSTATGLDYGGYPTARICTFGINLTL